MEHLDPFRDDCHLFLGNTEMNSWIEFFFTNAKKGIYSFLQSDL